MDNPGYEPLLDSKWAIPLVAILILFMMMGLAVIRAGLFLSRKLVARRAPKMAPTRPALPEASFDSIATN